MLRIRFLCCLLALPSLGAATELESLERSLRDTEVAFAASLAAGDFETFVSYLDEEAVFVTATTLRGRAEVAEAWKGYFEPGAARLRWKPCRVAVRAGGTLGLSSGPYWIEADGEEADTVVQGTFFSVWKRLEDGGWRVVFDSGTDPAPGPIPNLACDTD